MTMRKEMQISGAKTGTTSSDGTNLPTTHGEAMNAVTKIEPISESVALINMIERVARDPSLDIARLEKLLELRERTEIRRAEQEFNSALAYVQTEIVPVVADSVNTQVGKSKYASYVAMDAVVRPIYSAHGFALSFNSAPTAQDHYIRIMCHVSHRGGHSREYSIDMPADGKGARGNDVMTKTHATGSAITYGMRQLLRMIFNVAVDKDDDGNAASYSAPQRQEPPKQQRQEPEIQPMESRLFILLSAQIKQLKTPAEFNAWAGEKASDFGKLTRPEYDKLEELFVHARARLTESEVSK